MRNLIDCPGCSSSSIVPLYRGRTTRLLDNAEWSVHECRDCSLGFLNPQPDWSDLESYYTEAYPAYQPSHGAEADDTEILTTAREAGIFRHIPIPEGKRLLDVGCGGGFFIRICSKLGAEVQGVEPSPIAAERARSLGLKVFNGTLDAFETNDRFDVITANQVLEHVPDPVATLCRMREFLAPGGMIWIAVPNGACVWHRKLKWKWDGADLPFHLLHFSPRSILSAAERAGLSVRRLYTRSEPGIVAFSMRKYLKENWHVPERIGRAVCRPSLTERLGRWLDARTAGDNLIVELVDRPAR